MEILESRLRGRGTETEDSLSKRLATAKAEMDWGLKENSCDHVIVNDDVETAYRKLVASIFGTKK